MIVQPGDRVILSIDDDVLEQDIEVTLDRLEAKFPGVDFVVLEGLHVEAVFRPGDAL